METNYELKHKCLLVPLKAVLLVLAMTLVGFTTFAQSGKSVRVANNRQLIEAMKIPSVETITLEEGYYEYLQAQVSAGTIVRKYIDEGGNRDFQCQYFTFGANVCFNPVPPETYVPNTARADQNDTFGCGCCPPDNAGRWSCEGKPAGADVVFFDTTLQVMDFYVDKPGAYLMRYTWPSPYNSLVETQYYFYTPNDLELTAPDVCGLSTTVDFYRNNVFPDPAVIVEWTLDGLPYAGPDTTDQFELTVPWCGLHTLKVVAYTPGGGDNKVCGNDSVEIVIDFSCQPIADAGPDLWVCDDICGSFLYGSTGIYTYSPSHAWSWVQVSGPDNNMLHFSPNNGVNELQVGVCVIEDDEPDFCPYGEYEVEFQVQNGLCYDDDSTFVRFYEQPEADAGADKALCNTFSFTLAAVPFNYCGVEGENYWPDRYWEVSAKADPNATITFTPDKYAANVVVTITTSATCPFGDYTFKWNEFNNKYPAKEEGCEDFDYVTVTVFQDPEPYAGETQYYCETFAFDLDGTLDMPCYTNHAYTYWWELTDQPDACTVTIEENAVDPSVSITNCSSCEYGEYTFRLYQQTGYFNDNQVWVDVCTGFDDVSVWIFEEPANVDAGLDQDLCDDFTFDLEGSHDLFCGDAGVNNFVWYSWILISQPDNCDVIITGGETLTPSVSVQNCETGQCAYGEYKFRFTVYNGTELVYCDGFDEVIVTVFEQPDAEAGPDVAMCLDIDAFTYCYTMQAVMDNCYSMYGEWTKSCGPGMVTFSDPTDPEAIACFPEPGRYKFDWTVTSTPGCTDSESVTFDLLEQPVAIGTDDELIAPCDAYSIDLVLAGIDKYDYVGDEWTGDPDECPNYWDKSHWSVVSGPGGVTFADDEDYQTEMYVTVFGCYTVQWNEVNMQIEEDFSCEDAYEVLVVFVETPTPDAGDDASFCGPCYTMDAVPYLPANCLPAQTESYWELIGYVPPVDPCLTDQFAIPYPIWPVLDVNYYITDVEDPYARICVADDCLGSNYGTYIFRWVNASGFCIGYDTVSIEFKKIPVEVALYGYADVANYCGELFGYPMPGFKDYLNGYCEGCMESCLLPGEKVIEVCAESCATFDIDWFCSCYGAPIPGYTYEWSFIGPAGSTFDAAPYWYDCDEECWKGDDYVYICFGECCDTARLYLTITTPQGCTTTEEWKFYVNHLPCANIEGPAVSEVDAITEYCNVCPPEFDMDCLLYTWTAEHCGEIISGQGTECIEVLWTDYNVNGGWGEITMTTYDTCTGCCNYDEMMVKIYPAGTLGDATLSGFVYYDNDYDTRLNEVEVQLWNTLETPPVPVMSTLSFTDVEGGNGVGYYKFTGISATTPFGVTATYPEGDWFGANATDALAVQLKALNWPPTNIPPASFTDDALAGEAMDVNFSQTINGTDALWIKQRAIGMVGYFPAGDWVFEPGMTTTSTLSYDIKTLNAGDANRTNIPDQIPQKRAIDLLTNGTINVVSGEVFELPIQVAKADQFGAITLNLEYNSALIEVVEVVPVEGMISNITDGSVKVAWSEVNPMVLAENDVVLTLKMKAIGEVTATSLFSIGVNSEFADPTANVIEPVTLKTFGITTAPAAVDYFLSNNRPNPFSNSTFIEYTMPETGKVRLSVLDMLGQELAVLVDATQAAGSYTVEFSAAGLATGVYMYKITVDGETRDFISTQRMIISH